MRKALSIQGVLRRIALIVLPEPVLYRIQHYIKRQRPRTAIETAETASDRRKISPQQNVELWVYWSDVPNVGRGPTASLFVLREEVLRFDCFGGSRGHMHLNPEQQHYSGRDVARLYLQDGSRAEHTDRVAFELIANTDAALKSNRLSRVHNFPIDQSALADAANQMRLLMQELLERRSADELTGVHASSLRHAR